MDFDEKRVRQF